MTAYKLAGHIVVDRDGTGAPRITIDGEVFPWYTAGIVPSVPKIGEPPTLTITILADKVTTIDQYAPYKDPLVEHQPTSANDITQAGHECPSGPACCVCGKLTACGYRNFRDQWFCWPCANGESPEAKADNASGQPADGG